MKYLLCILLSVSSFGWGQNWGRLPQPAILAENGIKMVEVWKHHIEPLVEGEVTQEMKSELKELTKQSGKKEHTATWFLNKEGYPDSCWIFYRIPYEKQTYIYQFNADKKVVYLQKNRNDRLIKKSKIEIQKNGNIHCLYWNEAQYDWAIDYILREDSLFIRSRTISDTTGFYFDDRSTGVIGRAVYKDGELRNRYYERWTTTSDGKPDSLYITFEQFLDTTSVSWRSGSFVRGFKLNEDGSVIPAHGMDYYQLNYFKRGHKKQPFDELKPFDQVVQNFFRANEITDSSEIYVNRQFSNVHPQYFMQYTYTKY
jgi:hypothetical protein